MKSILALLGLSLAAPAGFAAGLPSPTVPDGLGVNIHFTGEPARDLDLIQAGGFKVIRMDFHWSGIEKQKGVYDFSAYDQLTEGLAKRGIRALYILDYSNNLYEKERSVRTEEGRRAFAAYAAAAAKRYRGRGILWELWNEPNISFWQPQPSANDYMALARAVFPAIRAADPEAIRIAPATSSIPLDFLEQCFRRGLLDLVEGITVHPYRQSAPETVEAEYLRLRALIARYRPDRPDMPVLSGEWGYSTGWAGYDDARQGQFLPRQFLTNLSLGVPVSIWYDWRDDGLDPKEPEHHFGSVFRDYRPKPAYLALQRLVEGLKGLRFVKRLHADPEDRLLLFSDGQRHVLAAWTLGQAHEVTPLPGKPISLTGDPQYVPVPAEAEAVLAEGAWTIAQRSVGARGGARASQPLAPEFEVRVRNPFAKPVAVRLQAAAPPALTGSFTGSASFDLAPGKEKVVRWRGSLARGVLREVPVTVTAQVGQFQSRQQVPFLVTNPLTVDVAPDLGGALAVVLRDPSGDGFRGTVTAQVGSNTRSFSLEFRRKGERMEASATGPNAPARASVQGDTVRILLPVQPASGQERVRVTLREGDVVVADSGWLRFVPLAVDTQTAKAFNDGDAKVPAKFELSDVPYSEADAPAKTGVRLSYEYSDGWKFVRIAPPQGQPVEGKPRAIGVWVRGSITGASLRMRFDDSVGRTFQPQFGLLDTEGWRYLTAPLDDPNVGKWGGQGDPGQIVTPIRLNTFVLVDGTRKAMKGDVEFAGFRLVYKE